MSKTAAAPAADQNPPAPHPLFAEPIPVAAIEWKQPPRLPGPANHRGSLRVSEYGGKYQVDYLPRLRHIQIVYTAQAMRPEDRISLLPIEMVSCWHPVAPAAE